MLYERENVLKSPTTVKHNNHSENNITLTDKQMQVFFVVCIFNSNHSFLLTQSSQFKSGCKRPQSAAKTKLGVTQSYREKVLEWSFNPDRMWNFPSSLLMLLSYFQYTER